MTQQNFQDSRTNGRWTKQEHQKFILGLQLYGKDWKKIQTLIGTRNGAQIRSHAQKFFIKIKKQFENTQANDHWQQTKESPPQNASSLVCHSECQTKAQYSYYLNKIVQKDALKSTFNFWEALVDHKPMQEYQLEQTLKRKNSFVSLGRDNGEVEGLQPKKKIKYE